MFRLCRYQVPPPAARCRAGRSPPVKVGGALDAEIIRFGRAAREDDLLGRCPYEIRHLRSGSLDDGFGFPSVGVRSGVGIAVGSDLED